MPYPMAPPGVQNPGFRPNGVPTKEVWRSPQRGLARNAGDELLSALRHAYGGIVYIKTNDYQQIYYMDREKFFRFSLAPDWLIPPGGTKHLTTEIGPDWVRREALSLLGYTYVEMSSDRFSISGDLEFVG